MNKSDLIDAMAEHAGITKAAAKKALECMLSRNRRSITKRKQSFFSRFRFLVSF